MRVKLEEVLQRSYGYTLLEVLNISKKQANEAFQEGKRKYQTPSNFFEQMKIDKDKVVDEMVEAIQNGVDNYSTITAQILLKQRETIDLSDFIVLWVIIKNFIEEHKPLFGILRVLGKKQQTRS